MKKLVVISGAGISAESGLATFRDGNGLWNQYRIEDVAHYKAWDNNPTLVQQFYNERRKDVIRAVPNTAHLAISELQKYFDVHVITQNVDDLHERAGTKNVMHLHGNIRYSKSSSPKFDWSGMSSEKEEIYFIEGDTLNHPNDRAPDGYPLRPHVVWFGEAVPLIDDASVLVSQADIIIVVGTSLEVYPAANLIYDIKPDAQVYCIDPNTQNFTADTNITFIKDVATNGMAYIKQALIDSL